MKAAAGQGVQQQQGGGGGGGGGGTVVVDDRIKGPWSPEEDVVLNRLVEKFGARNWSLIARGIPGRSGKSCRLRWCNQLNPGVKRKPFTGEFCFVAHHPPAQAPTHHKKKKNTYQNHLSPSQFSCLATS
jgi:hypothetical protein